MKYYLDLEDVSGHFSETHGLIEICQAQAESMVANDDRLELRLYTADEPAFQCVSFKKLFKMDERAGRVDKLYTTSRAFAETLREWDGEDEQIEALSEMFSEFMTPESRAQLVFQGLTSRTTTEDMTLSTGDKAFALSFAETVGPDWAQWMYRFAVLVTKLA